MKKEKEHEEYSYDTVLDRENPRCCENCGNKYCKFYKIRGQSMSISTSAGYCVMSPSIVTKSVGCLIFKKAE